MKRIFLFLATNLAIIVVLSISLRLLGVESILDEQGVDLNLNSLLIFAAVFGFGGAFISLDISTWMAKRTTGATVIEQPANESERWLVETVKRQAERAGIGMPEVAIFPSQALSISISMPNQNSTATARLGMQAKSLLLVRIIARVAMVLP